VCWHHDVFAAEPLEGDKWRAEGGHCRHRWPWPDGRQDGQGDGQYGKNKIDCNDDIKKSSFKDKNCIKYI